jgi:HAD superfamily hydrolase (TIGR01509 family)
VRREFDVTVRGVIFDCDGVLTHSEAAWGEAERELCRRYGADPGRVDQFMTAGLSMAETVRTLLGDEPPGGVKQAEDVLTSIAMTTLPLILVPAPGVIALLHELSEDHVVAVASNTPRPLLLRVLDALGVAPFLTSITSADDVAHPKPAPDLFLKACEDLGLPPGSVVVVEDSPTGVQAARAAGCRVIQVAAEGVPEVVDVDVRLDSLSLPLADLIELIAGP